MFWGNILRPSTVKVEMVGLSYTFVTTYQSTWCPNPEDNLHEKLKFSKNNLSYVPSLITLTFKLYVSV
jgi:hypothetical protein